jgi:hypothetical protein
MKTELKLRIASALATTTPQTPARNKALTSVKWVLREACGLFVGMDGLSTALVPLESATVFDGRDNEAMKLKYFTATTGGKFTIEMV